MIFERLRLQLTILFGALRRSGLRSLLVILAVGIGSTSLMTMLAMSAGTRQRLTELTELSGRNLIMIKSGRSTIDAESSLLAARMTLADSAALAEEIPEAQLVLPVLQRNEQTVTLRGENVSTSVLGVTERYFDARNWQRNSGRLLDELDDISLNRVAVVGAAVAKRLNAGDDLTGATLLIAGVPFEVVGQLREKGIGSGARTEDANIYVPLRVSLRRLFNLEDVSHLLVQVRDRRDMAAVEQAAAAVLRATHRLPAGRADDFEILRLVRQNEISSATQALVQRITQIVAVILLALGGIGVFAVTYFNAAQRTPEVGLRRALGARKRHIATMFTAEACVLSALGGCFGCVLGCVAIYVLARLTHWEVNVNLPVMALPLLISLLIGIVFGVVPALRAARLPPVEALRAA